MEYVILLVVTLLGFVFYFKYRKDNAEALNKNIDMKNKQLELDKVIILKDNELKIQESERKLLLKQLEEESKKLLNEKDMEDFFNK